MVRLRKEKKKKIMFRWGQTTDTIRKIKDMIRVTNA